jgi:hypothetical protein
VKGRGAPTYILSAAAILLQPTVGEWTVAVENG